MKEFKMSKSLESETSTDIKEFKMTKCLDTPLDIKEFKMAKSLESQTTNKSKHGLVGVVVYLAFLANALSSEASKALIMDKSCRQHLNEKCDYLRDQNELNNLHRYLYSYYVDKVKLLSVIQYVLTIPVLLLVGAWSDETGRQKVTLLLPVMGWTLQSISGIVNTVFFYELSLELHLFLDSFLVSFVGGPSLLFLALLNYACKLSTGNKTMYRIVAIALSAISSISFGIGVTEIFIQDYGYLPIYGLALLVNIINLLYIIFKVADNDRTDEQMKYDGQSIKQSLKSFFNYSTIKETCQVIFKKTADSRTLHLSLYLFIITTLFISIFGELSIMDVIVRYYYKWEKTTINTFFMYYALATILGLLQMVIVFEIWFEWHEFTIGIISSVCKIISALVFCFIPNEILFFIGPIVAMFNGGALLVAISQCTKLLEKNELGKINILICLLWNVAMIMYMPMKFRVNRDTIYELENPQHLWGAVYLLGGAFAFPALIAFIWLLRDLWKREPDNMDTDNLIVNKI